ncbi:M50 family metallopeptidase [Amycolatopsis aidingensis]|uniref:M50 family metallopeptidase n=1 Tax=Amycolatopsis aidingensis TaxID=2842453 RepID=UPI001C0CE312|nr:M50 family metallopeptidase [Amycolatopsis aidingensis]
MGRYDTSQDLTRLVTCHHEAGHAIAHQVGGGTVHHVRIVSDHEGYMRPADEFDPDNPLPWLVMILAGSEAAARFLTRHGYSLGEGRRIQRGWCHDDRTMFRRYARGTGIAEGRARREAQRLVRRHWRQIDRLATKLDRRGRLTGPRL